jgi:hypothetical protein
MLLHERIHAEMKRLGHVVFTSGEYNLNLVGLRAASDEANLFDDMLCITYRDEAGAWQVERFPCTTDPGRPWLLKPMREAGCAIVVHGQYRSVWTFGLHKGKYEALVQCGTFTVWRDHDKDGQLDRTGPTHLTNNSGINLHKAGKDSPLVELWSAGCQVLKREADFLRVMELARAQKAHGMGDKFTYTLIDVGIDAALADLAKVE